MQLQNYFAQDKSGNALPGATVYILLAGTATMVTGLQDKNGNPKANPFLSDSQGLIQFAAANGDYDIRVVKGPLDYKLTSVRFEDSKQFRDDAGRITDYWLASDGTDWAPAFSRIIAAGKRRVWVPNGNYGFSSTVFGPAGLWIDGEGRGVNFYHNAGGSFTGGYLFQLNTSNGVTWSTPFPNMNTGGFRRVQFSNPNSVASARAVKCFGSGRFEQLRFSGLTQSISRPSGFYIDSLHLEDIIAENPQGNTEYQFDILGLGDGFIAKNIHCPYHVPTTSSVLAMKLRGIHGGTVESCIGGDYLVELCGNLNIVGGHFERAQHIYDSSSITVDSQFLPDVRIPIITRGTFASASNESRFTVKLQNTKFRNIEGLMEWAGFHVQAAPSVTLDIENCSQDWTADGDFQRSQQAGIRICQDDGVSAVTSFNNNSWITSRRSVVDIPGAVNLNHGARIADSTFPGISSSRVEAVGTRGVGINQWLIAAGTYYYNVQVLYDAIRAIGRNPVNAEVSLAAALSTMNVLNVGFGTAPRNAIIRLYRGTSAGSYSHFVDIHTMGSTWLHDNGLRCNGISWQSRTPAAMNAINSLGSYIKFEGILIELTSAALPNSAGNFTQGDRVKRTDGTIDASSMLLIGNHRLTTGSGGVVGTDWANMRTSHVSPSV